MSEFLPHFISGVALAVVGWVYKGHQNLRATVHDLELRQVVTETQATSQEKVLSKLQETVDELPTRRDLEAVKEAVCQRIDDLRS